MGKVSFVAPHSQAAEVGLSFLKQGCSAIDAMVAAAASITVLYPHMNSIGGDSFWLIARPGEQPIAIDACGYSARNANIDFYNSCYGGAIPSRGPGACLTQAGTLAGWDLARSIQEEKFGTPSANLNELLLPAIKLANQGIKTTHSLSNAITKCLKEIQLDQKDYSSEFLNIFTPSGIPLKKGDVLKNPGLGKTFERLSEKGLRDFYEGGLATEISQHLTNLGSPLAREDFTKFSASQVEPICAALSVGSLYNLPPPTQGIASLIILGIFDRFYQSDMPESQIVHVLVEATKLAFGIRDQFITDPKHMTKQDINEYLTPKVLDNFAKKIGQNARQWPKVAESGDTVWMGCIDQQGTMVSFIQSVYWEFGSCVIIPDTGIVWNNRGLSFKLQERHHNGLKPLKKPLHTLNPAYASLNDGGRIIYGTMGGEGQPQTQAAIFTRAIYQNISLKEAIDDGRWLLGRTWGLDSNNLKIETSLYQRIGKNLEETQHDIQVVANHQEMMGHAGAIRVDSRGEIESASDPRSDGAALLA